MIIYEDILKEFQEKKVRYVIVGGIAFNLLGSVRSTFDLDILVEMTDDNLANIVNILKKNGYRVKQPVDPTGIANRETRRDWIENKGMKAFNFYKEDGLKEVDLIIESPVSFEEAKKSAIVMTVDEISLPVISIDNLIKMKEAAGRDMDKLDVEELKKIKEIKEER